MKKILLFLFSTILILSSLFFVACKNDKAWFGTYYADEDSYLEITKDCVRDEKGNENSYKLNGNVLEIDGYTRNPSFYQDYNVLSFNVTFKFYYGTINAKQGFFSQSIMPERGTIMNFNLDGTYNYVSENLSVCHSGHYRYKNSILELKGKYLTSTTSFTMYYRVLDDGTGYDIGVYVKNPTVFFGEEESIDVFTEGLEYELLNDSYAVVGFGNVADENIIIPSMFNGKEVTSIADSAFSGCDASSVSIPNTVISIGDKAFAYCENLTDMVVPHSVKTIGDNAFEKCENLISVTIGESVTTIGDEAFWNCRRLTIVKMGNGVTHIGSSAFSGCENLISITIPQSVLEIKEYAFSNCWKLIEVVNQSELNIIIGDYFTNGGVGYHAKNIISNDVESNIMFDNSYIFYNDNGNYSLLGYCGAETELILPTQINGNDYNVYQYAFSYNRKITSVTMPNCITNIGDSAFEQCTLLKEVNFGESIISIGDWAFRSYNQLTSIVIPRKVENIGYAFTACYNLENVYYCGESDEWEKISISRGEPDALLTATIYYYSETAPNTGGNYWHYVNGEITVW